MRLLKNKKPELKFSFVEKKGDDMWATHSTLLKH